MRILVRLAVTGSVLLMAGEMLAIVSALGGRAPLGWSPGVPLAGALIVSGLLCGAVVVAIALTSPKTASAAPAGPAFGRRRRAAGGPAGAGSGQWPGAGPWHRSSQADGGPVSLLGAAGAGEAHSDGTGGDGTVGEGAYGGAAYGGAAAGRALRNQPGTLPTSQDPAEDWLSDIRSAGPVGRRPQDPSRGERG